MSEREQYQEQEREREREKKERKRERKKERERECVRGGEAEWKKNVYLLEIVVATSKSPCW